MSFYGAESNDSFVNLGDVPLPIKSDASGQIGISTVHIGSVQNVADILKKLPFSAQIQNITESGTSFVTINRENVTEAEQEIQLSDDADLSKLPILNNLLLPDSFETNTIADWALNCKTSELPEICIKTFYLFWKCYKFVSFGGEGGVGGRSWGGEAYWGVLMGCWGLLGLSRVIEGSLRVARVAWCQLNHYNWR